MHLMEEVQSEIGEGNREGREKEKLAQREREAGQGSFPWRPTFWLRTVSALPAVPV